MKELRILDSSGICRLSPAPMDPELTREALRWMLLSRAIDDLAIKLQRLGRVGLYGPVHGQEASVVGSALALHPERDWMVPASREQPAMLRHGLPLDALLAAYMGRFNHAAIPQGLKLLPRQQSIGAQLPHAAGLAWSLRIRRLPGVVLVYCGDGASSEGDFHEAANLAGVMRAPLVIVLINNQYAISTPFSRQTAATRLAARAAGYGFPGVAVDGNDVFAVYAATSKAVERALGGEGPTLIECRTYRVGFHNTSDNPRQYRDDAEVRAAMARDPIERLQRYVLDRGIWSAEDIEAVRRGHSDELQAAVRRVAALPPPGPEAMFENVYEVLPERVAKQRAATIAAHE